MSDCCSLSCSDDAPPKQGKCPVNGKEYSTVTTVTIKHHIKEPWSWESSDQRYYFCDDPECDVVYFGEDSTVINKSEIRTKVGAKEKSPDRLVCYCFGVAMEEAMNNPLAKTFVIRETKNHQCACEFRNPSGRCCLKDFPKA